jgi:hypothetical protein
MAGINVDDTRRVLNQMVADGLAQPPACRPTDNSAYSSAVADLNAQKHHPTGQ